MEYWFSNKGEEMYKAIEKAYPKHSFDVAYDIFKRKTKGSTQNEFIITKMVRLQVPGDEDVNLEYILYDLKEIRYDGLGNKKYYVRTNLGKYPIPSRTVIRTFDEDNQPIITTGSVSEVHTGYEFPFTTEKADELHKWCKDKITATNTKKTEYIVQKLNEMKISVDSFKSWKEGDFETLYQYGNAEGIETPVVRPKAKKSKEKEVSDLQREILRKQYTVKPKEVVVEKQEKEIVTTEASVA